MSLVNIAYAQALTWADPSLTRLEDQSLVPMYGDHPIELGLDRADPSLLAIARDTTYQRLFRAAFDEEQPFTRDNVVKRLPRSIGRSSPRRRMRRARPVRRPRLNWPTSNPE